MSNCIAIAIGYGRDSEMRSSRLGSKAVAANANTHNTFIATHLNADGSGHVIIERADASDGPRTLLAHLKFSSEFSTHAHISATGLLGDALAEFPLDARPQPDGE